MSMYCKSKRLDRINKNLADKEKIEEIGFYLPLKPLRCRQDVIDGKTIGLMDQHG